MSITMITPEFLRISAIFIAIILSSMGTAIGEGLASVGSIMALARQPLGSNQNFRTLLLGLALVESGGILALVIALFLMFICPAATTWGVGFAYMGMGCAVGIAGIAVSISSSFAVKAACSAVARQPFFAQKIMTFMLVTQSMIEAPVLFSFIIAFLIRTYITPDLSIYQGMKLCAAGLMVGLGCIGPSIGQAFIAEAACTSVGINRAAYRRLFVFSLMNQAIIETPMLFCLLLSMLFIFKPIAFTDPMSAIASMCAAVLCMGLASLGTGVGTGYVGSVSCSKLTTEDDGQTNVLRASFLAQVFIESSAIYGFIISLILLLRLS